MTKPITSVPNTFASATSPVPLYNLDQNFSAILNFLNDPINYSNFIVDSGTTNAVVLNYPSGTNLFSLVQGLFLQFKASNTNTGSTTLEVRVNGSSIGSAVLKNANGSNLVSSQIVSGGMYSALFDGSNFYLFSGTSTSLPPLSSLVLNGATSGSVTLTVPAVSGSNTITFPAATGNALTDVTTGVCRAWVNFNGSTAVIRDKWNVSSITRFAAGSYTVNFSTAFSNVNYVVAGTHSYFDSYRGGEIAVTDFSGGGTTNVAPEGLTKLTTSCRVYTFVSVAGSPPIDANSAYFAFHGN